MTDDTPDYVSYSLAQLYDVEKHVNRERFPERYALIRAQIEAREANRGAEETELGREKENHNSRVRVWAWGFLAISAFFFSIGFVEPVIFTWDSRNWRRVPCTIEVRPDKNGSDKVRFRYEVGGVSYLGERLRSSDNTNNLTKGERRRFADGDKSTCLVNPDDPRQAVWKWGADWGWLFVLAWCGFGTYWSTSALRHPEQVRIKGRVNPHV